MNGVRMRVGAASAVALLATIVLVGCNAQARPAPSATALPDGVTAELVPSPDLGRAIVKVRNATGEDLEIGSLRVDSPLFAWPASATFRGSREVGARTTSLLFIDLPRVSCDDDALGPAHVRMQFTIGASSSVASARVADPAGIIAALRATDCAPSQVSSDDPGVPGGGVGIPAVVE